MSEEAMPVQAGPQFKPSPEILYKYLPPERIDMFENMEVRFSRPSEFNDTFDTHYLVPKSQGSMAVTNRVLLRNQLGIFCLTERSDDHLMWVHYARNHTGFVLGFDAHASFFREKGRKLNKVIYRSAPEVSTDPGIEVCFCKSTTWKHEREWRCVRYFENSESRVVRIEPALITQVIFGSRMEAWQISRMMLYVTAYEMTHTRFLLSTPISKSWAFENRPKKMSLCDACGGDGYLVRDSED